MRGFINSETLTDIANAIRAKTKKTGQLAPGAMAAEIAALPEGAGARDFVENGFPQVAPWNDNGTWNDPELTKIGIRLANLEIPNVINLPGVLSVGDWVFSGTSVRSVTLNNTKNISGNCFNSCTALTTVNAPEATSVGLRAFSGCSALENVTLTKVQTIGGEAFRNCKKIAVINLPNAEAIEHNNSSSVNGAAFTSCTNLTTVRLGKTCTFGSGLYKTAFVQCSKLTDIYVPWSEGEVEGAPWGASNATIHYDTPYQEAE